MDSFRTGHVGTGDGRYDELVGLFGGHCSRTGSVLSEDPRGQVHAVFLDLYGPDLGGASWKLEFC